jgi:hypothetical protein
MKYKQMKGKRKGNSPGLRVAAAVTSLAEDGGFAGSAGCRWQREKAEEIALQVREREFTAATLSPARSWVGGDGGGESSGG